MDWLRSRVLEHRGPSARTFVTVIGPDVIGHALARAETGCEGPYGLFSTIYISPEFRRRGLASNLSDAVEDWFREIGITRIVYNTASNNQELIGAFQRRGYRITLEVEEMVQLTKKILE